MTQEEIQNYIPGLRKRILEHLEDLKNKIKNDEPLPHGNQDMELLIRV